jgi:hypothetical protein
LSTVLLAALSQGGFVEVAEFVPADFEPAFEAYAQVDAADQLDVLG